MRTLKITLSIIIATFLFNSNISASYIQRSVLADGKWVKISINESGIHKIPYSSLKSWGFSNPSKVQVFGYGGVMVPNDNRLYRPDDLPKVAIWHHNDNIYFYGQGRDMFVWDEWYEFFNNVRHIYEEKAYYFLSETDVLTNVETEEKLAEEFSQYNVTEYDNIQHHEIDNSYILPAKDRSGRKVYGEVFSMQTGYNKSVSFDVPNIVTTEPVEFLFAAAARSAELSFFNLKNNNEEIAKLIIPKVAVNNYEGYYAQESKTYKETYVTTSNVTIDIELESSYSSATGWLDYLTINSRAKLAMVDNHLIFRDKNSYLDGGFVKFIISNSKNETVVWDITDIINSKRIDGSFNNGNFSFVSAPSSDLKTFVAFNPSEKLPTPKFEKDIPNQNLHSFSDVEYVIVAPKEFFSYANRLAELHRQHNNLNPLIVDIDAIYNEFSWGHKDPTAIRSFMRMLYDKAEGDEDKEPKYLLLFGNGYYNNKDSSTPEHNSWIPTYQSENSLHYSNSYVSDDYFGFLEPNAGINDAINKLSIGIGRLPIRNKNDAEVLVNKIERYLTQQSNDRWRKTITFIGDDGDNNIHIRDSEDLAERVKLAHEDFQVDKIYLDSYIKTSNDRYPDAKDAVDRAINDGTLLINFIGHGGISGLTHELVITHSSIDSWRNHDKLPLFVTATCEFSRFDNPTLVSAGEKTLLNPNGGGIGLLTTTRLAWSGANKQLNDAFINNVFLPLDNGRKPRFGDIIKKTKNNTKATINKLNFTLLGDPALSLNYPENKIVTTKINNKEANNFLELDTLKALSIATIEAQVYDYEGNFLPNFNGKADIIVYDKSIMMETLGNKGNIPYKYAHRPNIIFQGETEVVNGNIKTQFMVPYDIRYNIDSGRISYYAVSEDKEEDAMGSFSDFMIGGFNPQAGEDNEGPEIDFYLDYKDFKNGDKTGSTPILYASFFDESGINTTGAGIGHNIVLILDEQFNNPIQLNRYYIAKQGTYKEGNIIYQLPELEKGEHNIILKAWDNYNNSTSISLDFIVSTDKNLIVNDFNFTPTPVKLGESNTLSFSTSEGNIATDIIIHAYDQMGNKTGEFKINKVATNNFITPITLSLSEVGIKSAGIYVLKFEIESMSKKKTVKTSKVIVLP